MTLYADASAIVATVSRQPNSRLIDPLVRDPLQVLVVSDFALAESAAALAKLGRVEEWSTAEAAGFFEELDAWATLLTERVEIEPSDLADANMFVRMPRLSLRAPDAIHIAAATRLEATILTLDRGMARAATALGVPCLNPAEAEAPGEPKD
ncbi:type II toxin-antitoxin system VapC family toxin [Brevundimonas subvibrioides]|uniref:type II toxin-antitoxin system VapC family toxin n=1 Tax=Brevundimonas subvibrioides TaxID=74313 RepID=UPI0022B5B5A4|nr:type II toxin-antitoxin system VapC family toxin [Brevundimonas subvibrioides]